MLAFGPLLLAWPIAFVVRGLSPVDRGRAALMIAASGGGAG
jgi:hypothetical protein